MTGSSRVSCCNGGGAVAPAYRVHCRLLFLYRLSDRRAKSTDVDHDNRSYQKCLLNFFSKADKEKLKFTYRRIDKYCSLV